MQQKNKLHLMVFSGLFAALIALATMFFKIPTAIGYANLGDGFILGAAVLLGPLAGAAAGLGSMLADLLLGYGAYAPATLVIKGLMGVLAGFLLRKKQSEKLWFQTAAMALAELLMVLGYFVFEWALYGLAAALGSVWPNLAQGAVGLVLGLILRPLLIKLYANFNR